MEKSKNRDFPAIINDVVLIGSALIAIVVSLLDFLGVLDSVTWLSDRVPVLILLSVGFLLISTVIERKTHITKIQRTLDNIIQSSTFGAQYLDEAETVTEQIERAVQNANESIMAIGAKSRATNYLNAVEESVLERRLSYYRLIDGEYIPHELHEHLNKLVHIPNVQISWTPREKFGNLTVTEKECILIFPGNSIEKFSGLWLPGQINSRKYSHYFLESFSKCLPIRTERAVESLCVICSPNIAGHSKKIRHVLEEELEESLKKSGVFIAGNSL